MSAVRSSVVTGHQ